ncbi:glycosyltransferase family 4 protein [Enterovibrio sp. ZSDZ42]|uniref:Glycosyltransferase family 4 protein n=1 Tax=Enterovibrio gelatinilyticus TaxID=2899819 RepID=A0ABT5R196_9GAMM|nr:glycosyltransferase family 4 protein [Enterovibrio sp. ZSDZ42]MDD1794043.1 glycosyltransferase family 4 protein [Enterovibrio sp. ZSDZ42]
MLVQPSPIHICHIVNSMADEMQNDQVFSNIRQFRQPEFEHTLIVLKRSKILSTKHLPANVSCLELNVGDSHLRQYLECRNALIALKPHVCMTYGSKLYPMQWVAKRLNVPVKLHVHRQEEKPRNALSVWFHEWMHRTLSHSSDFVVAPSDMAHAWLNQNAKIPSAKIKLIRHGIDSQKLCPPLRAVESSITDNLIGSVAVPSHRLAIGLNVSGLSKQVIVDFFDEYFAACLRSPMFVQQTLLIVVGNTPHLSKLQHELDNRGVTEKQVSFTGHLNNLSLFYKHIDIYVYLQPKEQHVSLLEAMSMGLPIASTRLPHQSPTNKKGHPVYWSTNADNDPLRDQLLELFLKSNKRLMLGRASRRYVQDKHHPEVYESQYRDLFQRNESPNTPKVTVNVFRQTHSSQN